MNSGVLSKLQKRRCYTLLTGGQNVLLRALTHREIELITKFEDSSITTAYVVGSCLLNDDESPAFARQQDESPEDFARRVNQFLVENDMPTDVTADIAGMAAKLSRNGSVEGIAKNS